MRIVVQRVTSAKVEIDQKVHGQIGKGLVVFLGIHQEDLLKNTEKLVSKLLNLRIFGCEKGKMNLSLLDIKGEILIVSQFTLYADSKGGNRPSFKAAAIPEVAIPIYNKFVDEIKNVIPKAQTGQFGANMQVFLVNDGPVTLILDNE